MQPFVSEEGKRRFEELWRMEWFDFDDFLRKYDSTVNTDSFVKRASAFDVCEIVGLQYRSGLIDFETVFAVCNTSVPQLWVKFRPIIEEYRKRARGEAGVKMETQMDQKVEFGVGVRSGWNSGTSVSGTGIFQGSSVSYK
jgi:hypothetical protein